MNQSQSRSPILPPSTLGLLGGGQLGKMTAVAARSVGYQLNALDPDPRCPIRPLVENFFAAGWDDVQTAVELAKSSDVVTFEIEKVSVASLEAAAAFVPVRPGPEVLRLVQNKLRQKRWLEQTGFPVGPFQSSASAGDLQNAVRHFGSCFVKAAEGGYDGRSQVRVSDAAQCSAAWDQLGGKECIAEKALDLEYELSVLVARRPAGEACVYPPAMNFHRDQVLEWSVLPAPVSPKIAQQAQEIAQSLAVSLQLEGILVVEMFVTRQGQLYVNELAPRPHNRYHASERACVTGQFEQFVRAICDLPLGSPELVRPGAIVNLLGNLWTESMPPDLAATLRVPETKLHLYGKSQARPGRKMGHLSSGGRSPEEALQRALRAKRLLVGPAGRSSRMAVVGGGGTHPLYGAEENSWFCSLSAEEEK